MTTSQFYKYAAILLLILNLGLFAFLILNKPPHDHRPDRKLPATELLKLNEEQEAKFYKSAEQHSNQVKKLSTEQKGLLRTYFGQLKNGTSDETNALLERVQEVELEKITSTYQHLAEVKQILNNDQLKYYDHFMDHMMSMVVPNDNQHPPRGHR